VDEGASYLHVVDLDASMGVGDNFKQVVEILAEVKVGVEVGGGIRSLSRANELLDAGADRVIFGTAAVKNPELVKELVNTRGGERAMVALDSRGNSVSIEGWQAKTKIAPLELAKGFEKIGVGSFLFTNIDVEGQMKGVKIDSIKRLVEGVKIPVFASGGVGSLEDIKAVRETGAAGLVVGMALYEGKFTLKQAFEAAK
jgi:phosphoribosylformimino-5-aminoimidazole carboxamide ribotide isomerase